MSLNHIVKDGLKDISLDVKNINCTSITVNNLPIGSGSLQSAYNGGNTILTAPGFPIELTGVEGLNLNSNPITTGKLTFPNLQELVSRQYVDDAIASISPSSTTLQDAYDNGNGQIALSISKPLEITGTEGINVNANSVLTTKLTFTDAQELVSRQYVDDAINSVSSPFTYFRGNGNVTQTVYEDTFVRLIWDSLNSQPKWLRKSAVNLNWIDAGIQLTHEPLVQEFITSTDDISTAINTEFYFTESGSLNSNFNMSDYGNLATTWITPEFEDSTFPAYLSRWVLGSQTGCLTVSIERMI